MQTRISFNGGEMSPEMAARADIDAFMRGCRILQNWELSQMGGAKRRRGMRMFAEGSYGARLAPYVYSYDNSATKSKYLVELGKEYIRVLDMNASEEAKFENPMNPEKTEFFQLNALLFLVSENHAPLTLLCDENGEWQLREYEFKEMPWRYENEKRDVLLNLTSQSGAVQVEFELADANDEDEKYPNLLYENDSADSEIAENYDAEAEPLKGDVLRASFWVERQEIFSNSEEARKGTVIRTSLQATAAGTKIAVMSKPVLTYWICTQTWPADLYKDGLDDPEDYPDNFVKPSNTSNYGSVGSYFSVHDVNNGFSIAKDTKFAIKSGYWEYYTCIKTFTALDMVAGSDSYDDYPDFFIRGLAIGDALSCRGAWEFCCSGAWFGCYDIRRCYDTKELTGEWETIGSSFSRLGEGANIEPTGDESAEECYLRLFITRSRYMGNNLLAGFPPDSCGNSLVVKGYRHDMKLKCTALDNGKGHAVWEYINDVKVEWEGRKLIDDWSWVAWSERYGFPCLVTEVQQRLVFASTKSQPQTVWLSRTGDFVNFALSDADDGAIAATLATRSQNPICWLTEKRGSLLMGTSEAEFSMSGQGEVTMKAENVKVSTHGDIGSARSFALGVDNSVLFLERGSGRVYEFGYDIQVDGWRSRDLTIFAPHALMDHGGATQATLLRKPDKVAVYVLSDGQLALCTYNAFHEVNAWHRWTTDGKITSACAMPDGSRSDRLFLLVEREDGCFIEVVDEDSEYVDNGERDYYSEVYTNALINPLEAKVDKSPKLPVNVLLGGETDTRLLEIRSYGTEYTHIAREAPTLAAGWHKLLTINSNEYENAVGLRFHGNKPCHILALQG